VDLHQAADLKRLAWRDVQPVTLAFDAFPDISIVSERLGPIASKNGLPANRVQRWGGIANYHGPEPLNYR